MLPLIAGFDAAAPLLWQAQGALSAGEFLRSVLTLAEALPQRPYLVNLCERREHFLMAWCAAAVRGQTNLLPASRAPQVIKDAQARYGENHVVDDEVVRRALTAGLGDGHPAMPLIAADHIIQIAFTSGSTGAPTAHAKQWGSLHFNTGFNAERIRECLPALPDSSPALIATVPPQHMYGTETSVLLPLLAGMTVHAARPLFPADVAAALAQVPGPRVLVTTPVHLRTLLASSQEFPQLDVVVSATAPLDAALALRVAERLRAPLLEMFGSTETCVIATRLTARESHWRLYPEVTLEPAADHTWVHAPWFGQPIRLQDVVETAAQGRMLLRGRNVDMIEIAGKRASLSDLTRRLLDIPGVRDAVVFQPSDTEAAAQGVARVQRVAAAVVAPSLSVADILDAMAQAVDPAFLPRPLLLLSELPRNELGKTARAQLLQLLHKKD
ncbi:MAG TPA: AMP-binding protein [Steroidobacteraceae bacterium]|jgi:acyl-coenzyme A synthetase/AMP-(fatty) acid ligase